MTEQACIPLPNETAIRRVAAGDMHGVHKAFISGRFVSFWVFKTVGGLTGDGKTRTEAKGRLIQEARESLGFRRDATEILIRRIGRGSFPGQRK